MKHGCFVEMFTNFDFTVENFQEQIGMNTQSYIEMPSIPRVLAKTLSIALLLGAVWLGEQVSERGIGNGISIIIFAGIVAGLPSAIGGTLELARTGDRLTIARECADKAPDARAHPVHR